jgi:hypothetical protein
MAGYVRPYPHTNGPVDEPRDNLWIAGPYLCAACAQLVDIVWGDLSRNDVTCAFITHTLWVKNTLDVIHASRVRFMSATAQDSE